MTRERATKRRAVTSHALLRAIIAECDDDHVSEWAQRLVDGGEGEYLACNSIGHKEKATTTEQDTVVATKT